jgi:hypothetical protein
MFQNSVTARENKCNFYEVKESFETQYSGRTVHIAQSDCGLFHEMKSRDLVLDRRLNIIWEELSKLLRTPLKYWRERMNDEF